MPRKRAEFILMWAIAPAVADTQGVVGVGRILYYRAIVPSTLGGAWAHMYLAALKSCLRDDLYFLFLCLDEK